jgi:hypothetical protein
MRIHPQASLALLSGLACVAIGVLSGITIDRVSFDRQRLAILASAQAATTERNRELMLIELRTHGRHAAFQQQWERAVESVDEALLLGDTAAAVGKWRDAYGMALRSGGWSELLEVGDAALRIGDAPESWPSSYAAARRSYVTALHRARAQHAVDGVIRITDAFIVLGDRDVAERCLDLARAMADTREARMQVQELASHFGALRPKTPEM